MQRTDVRAWSSRPAGRLEHAPTKEPLQEAPSISARPPAWEACTQSMNVHCVGCDNSRATGISGPTPTVELLDPASYTSRWRSCTRSSAFDRRHGLSSTASRPDGRVYLSSATRQGVAAIGGTQRPQFRVRGSSDRYISLTSVYSSVIADARQDLIKRVGGAHEDTASGLTPNGEHLPVDLANTALPSRRVRSAHGRRPAGRTRCRWRQREACQRIRHTRSHGTSSRTDAVSSARADRRRRSTRPQRLGQQA